MRLKVEGVKCPECGGEDVSLLTCELIYECENCGHEWIEDISITWEKPKIEDYGW
jgi:uncharacterized Zn finger protein